MLEELLALQQKIIPEMIELLDKRYKILKNIYYNQPIGRRALSQYLDIGERIVRTEINFLKEQGLIDINSIGMMTTKEGENILKSLQKMIHSINGLSSVEQKLKEYLEASKVIVVPGNIEEDATVLREIGRIAATYIKNLIKKNSIITLTGGTSVAQVIENFPRVTRENILVVPARGGIGSDVATQASTLASKLALRIGGSNKILHVPDSLSPEALKTIMQEPDIKSTMEMISRADILIFGIGRADEMSRRRGHSKELTEKLLNDGAVAEAFGYYFNKMGDIVYKTPTIGLNFSDVKRINNIVAVAGGANKAAAIIATKPHNPSFTLITDESAAKEIIRIKEKGI